MKPWGVRLMLLCLFLFPLSTLFLTAQQAPQESATPDIVPHLVKFSGVVSAGQIPANTSIVGVTVAIYKDQEGGAPLWIETQNASLDSFGHYELMLGATKPGGLPMELFASGEARWVGITLNGEKEQPRVLLLSVPYALKAADAETVGGLPPSAFVLAAPAVSVPVASTATPAAPSTQVPLPASVTGAGTADYVPLWTSTSALGNSVLFQSGTGSTAKLGIGTTTPAATLDIKGTEVVRGSLSLPAVSTATASAGSNSQPLNVVGSSYSSSSNAAVSQTFRWQVEPAGNNTATPSGTWNLLYGAGSAKPAETGLKIGSTGQIAFASGQTFPGTGPGTITGVTAGTDLTGGGTSGAVTLNLDTTKVPQLNTANTFTGNQAVNGNLSATGAVTGSAFQIGSNLFAFGSDANGNAFLGFAGNTTTTGQLNTASGVFALEGNTTGQRNTATGYEALTLNTTGSYNTAYGTYTLFSNTIGNYNTATGYAALSNTTLGPNDAFGSGALFYNSTGIFNEAFGYQALNANTVGGENVAVGAQALYSNVGGSIEEGWYNNAVGYQALYSNTTGFQNDAFGHYALDNNTTGYGNTAVGDQALSMNTTGNYNTCIGAGCNGPEGVSNATAIGAHARVSASNSLVLGGTGQYAVKVGIGTETPSNILTIAQGAGHPVSDSWETYSSRRWKTNIQTLPNALAKVQQLRGVSYDLKDSGKHEIGVIAEEVGAVVPELVSYEPNGKDARSVDYSRLTALLIEATKEQQRELQRQQSLLRTQAAALRTQAGALRTQAAAIRDLKSELQETRQSLQEVKAQVGSTQPALVAGKTSTKSQLR
jgi:endosialidase-like protein